MIPKFRAWGVEIYPGLKQPAPKMHRNVSVVTTYPEGITFILTDFNMLGDDEYSGSIIDDAILMQSTGLKDKNGQEIFEGDVVRVLDSLYTVFYDNERASYRLKPHDNRWTVDYMSNFSHGGNFEVKGNIYENPELLEVDHG